MTGKRDSAKTAINKRIAEMTASLKPVQATVMQLLGAYSASSLLFLSTENGLLGTAADPTA